MANTIITKNSSTAAAVPTAGQLVQGELAVNVTDKRIFTENAAGAIVEMGTNPSALNFADNAKANFGAGSDLQIYHDGSNSYVSDQGTGNLRVLAANFQVRNAANNAAMITAADGGSVYLYDIGDQKLVTTATGIDVTGDVGGDTLTISGAGSVQGLTVGRGAGAVATNTAVGASALAANTSGAFNTATNTALFSNTSGSYNTAVGHSAGYATTTGSLNSFFGMNAGVSNTAGAQNAFFGQSAGNGNTTGSYNVAVGRESLLSNTTASSNTAVGHQAGYTNTTGTSLVAMGKTALYNNTTGTYNTAIGAPDSGGQSTMGTNSTGAYNTAIGSGALSLNTTGGGSVAVGYKAGNTTTTGAYNVFIGPNTVASGVGTNQEVIIGSNGGAAVTGKGANTGFFNANGGGVYQGNNSSTWSTTSDQRLKKNIVDNTVGLDAITSIRVRNFEYRLPEEVDAELKPTDAIKKTGVQLGVIAQELQEVLPECVKQESTGVLSVDTDNLVWYLVNSIQELKAEIDLLKGN